MSLYGSGRAEGIGAVALITLLVAGVQAFAGNGWVECSTASLQAAGLCALGAALCYRFLRAQGRSRFTAFLVGAAYGMSPWLGALAAAPNELFAAALAPLPLEFAARTDRPSLRWRWTPWLPLAFAAPFLAGFAMIGALAAMFAATALLRTITCGDRDAERPPALPMAAAMALGGVAIASAILLAPLAAWFPTTPALSPAELLAAYRPAQPQVDFAGALRVPGMVLLWFTTLGMLRRQRHVDTRLWLCVLVAGAVPTIAISVPWLGLERGFLSALPLLPATAWWATLIGAAVLAAAGLDDFLDLPMRRRSALPWLFALTIAGAPMLPLLAAAEPQREWPLVATCLLLALLVPLWRRLGILRFKNVLAVVVLALLVTPCLQLLPMASGLAPAAPLGESAASAFAALLARPGWHYVAPLAVVSLCGLWSLGAWMRRPKASSTPKAARAAIVKKAKAGSRS